MTIKNRIMVAICHNGPASRAELSRRFGLSASHVSEATAELIEKGILTESGYRKSNIRGRKNTLIDFDLSYKFALGIGLADNVMSVGLTTVKGDILGKDVTVVDPHITKDELFDTALSLTMPILRNCCLPLSSLLGIGLCVKRSHTKRFYGDAPIEDIIADVAEFSGQKVLFEPAEEYLQMDHRILTVSAEELFLFGAAKVTRDLLLYADV